MRKALLNFFTRLFDFLLIKMEKIFIGFAVAQVTFACNWYNSTSSNNTILCQGSTCYASDTCATNCCSNNICQTYPTCRSPGATAGIWIGVIAGIVALVAIIVVCNIFRKKKLQEDADMLAAKLTAEQ